MQDDSNPDAAEQGAAAELADNAIPTSGYQMVPVVGLGAGAGGLEALKVFFAGMGAEGPLAFIVALNETADAAGNLLDALRPHTSLRVHQVVETRRIEPGNIYLLPAGKTIRSMDGHVAVSDAPSERSQRVAVDIFFRTLADTHGPHAAAVVLSGEEGDGVIGIKRIKERGGLTIAQDPDEARFAAMPRAVIGTGMVDWVLPAREMPGRLQSYFRMEKALQLPPEVAPAEQARVPDGVDEGALRDVLSFLRTRTGRDFSCYKRATILRRIGRRMQVNGTDNLAGYLNCLRTRPGEAGALLQDLLITVTNFFRDAECFAALEQQVPALFDGKGPSDAVRVWVVACATGEEAYSIAMLLSEYARKLDAPPVIQVFATDLDDDAIRSAREGIYPPTIEADVSDERLKRFFVKEHQGWRVRRELREMVLFAMHDTLKDSPFSRLDLVSCRNLLIYLNREAQTRVFETFHFALLPQGKLFLGSSESVEDGSPLFTVLDKKNRIYAQRSAPRISMPVPSGPGTLAMALEAQAASREGVAIAGRAFEQSGPSRNVRPADARNSSWGELHLRLLEQLSPPSVLIDGEYDIVHISPNAGRFLVHGGGEPSRNLLRLVHDALRIELRAALYQAAQSHEATEVSSVRLELGSETLHMTIRVVPANDLGAGLFLVILDDRPAALASQDAAQADPAAPRPDADPVARHLDRELERLKSHLRDTVEQYEASTEELKASNEELQAMNEELRSATEELETSREELQSINEELTTVNHELKAKVEELGHANSDMHNLMDATAIATVFLDRELRITRYTPSAVALFNLIPTDVGRPLTDLTTHLVYPDLAADAQRVLEKLVPVEREVGQADGSWYLARLLPYRTIEDRIAGVVLSFVNITERKQAEEARMWLAAAVGATPDGIISFALDQSILSWSRGAERIFGYTAAEAIGQPLRLLMPPDENEQRDFVARIAAGLSIEHHEAQRRRKDGSLVDVTLAASPIKDATGRVVAGTAIVRDVSAAKATEEKLRRSEEELRQLKGAGGAA